MPEHQLYQLSMVVYQIILFLMVLLVVILSLVATSKRTEAAEAAVIDAVHDAAPGLPAEVAYNAHHSSYAALMRQLVKKGALLPTDLLGVSIDAIAKVTPKPINTGPSVMAAQ